MKEKKRIEIKMRKGLITVDRGGGRLEKVKCLGGKPR